MTAPEVLAALQAAGLSVRLDGERIMLSPKVLIGPWHREIVAGCRAELVTLLRQGTEEAEIEAALLDATPGLSSGLVGGPEWIPRRHAAKR